MEGGGGGWREVGGRQGGEGCGRQGRRGKGVWREGGEGMGRGIQGMGRGIQGRGRGKRRGLSDAVSFSHAEGKREVAENSIRIERNCSLVLECHLRISNVMTD